MGRPGGPGPLDPIFDVQTQYGLIAGAIAATPAGGIIPVTVEVQAGQDDPIVGDNVFFDVVFAESVTGFTSACVSLFGSAGATTVAISGSGTTYTLEVSGMTTDGTVGAFVIAGCATGTISGDRNRHSTSIDNIANWEFAPDPVINAVIWNADGDGSGIDFSNPTAGGNGVGTPVQAGDIMIMFWEGQLFSNNLPTATGGAAAWTQIDTDRTGSNCPTAMFAKISTGAETTVAFGGMAGNTTNAHKWLGLIIRPGSSWTSGNVVGASAATTSVTPPTGTGAHGTSMHLQMTVNAQVSGVMSYTGPAWTTSHLALESPPGGSVQVGVAYFVGAGVSPSFQWNMSGGFSLFWPTGTIVIDL